MLNQVASRPNSCFANCWRYTAPTRPRSDAAKRSPGREGGAGIGIDQRQLLDPDEFGARLQSWAHDGFRPAALDVKIEGLSAVRSVLGRRAESQVGQVLLRRMLGESQVLCVACVTAEDHFFLAEPHSDSWLPRVLGAVQTPILLDDGEVRVNGRFLQERRAM